MNIDPSLANSLGFPKPGYVFVERERRWLCESFPIDKVADSSRIKDLYVTGSQLRLREERSLSRKAPRLRLTRKVDADSATRLLSSIYLSEAEFTLLKSVLIGRELVKVRHRIDCDSGLVLGVDVFEGVLQGLVLLEVEFPSDEALGAYVPPPFAGLEVTDDIAFTGGCLVRNGLPPILGLGHCAFG